MASILDQIENVKREMDKQVARILKKHDTLSESKQYSKLLALNAELEHLYRELAFNEPAVYRGILIANAIRSDVIYKAYADSVLEAESETKPEK